MNKVETNCQKEENAKFYYASQKISFESKAIAVTTFFISLVPIILSIVTMGKQKTLVFSATMVSFTLTVILELLSYFRTTHKEHGILLRQMYTAGITGCSFSKIEHDREQANYLNELAIRKAEPTISSLKKFHVVSVPKEIEEKYVYLYLCRSNAASNNYLMGRMFAVYIFALALIIALFISFAFIQNNTFEFLQLIIQFYPLVLPVIRNINSCHKSMKYYTKISADIDIYFAKENKSPEKRARFMSYIQGLEFEAMMESPDKYKLFSKAFAGGLKKLNRGVTNRFIESIERFEGKKMKRLSPQNKIANKTTEPVKNKTENLKKSNKKISKANKQKSIKL